MNSEKPSPSPFRENASPSSLEDDKLVALALRGEDSAYKKLIAKYEKSIYFRIQKMIREQEMVEDLVQEVFIKAFNNLSSYSNEYAFSTWLFRIATNHTIDYLRKKKLPTFSINAPIDAKDGEVEYQLPDNSFEADREIIYKQRRAIIREAIDNLPKKYRLVIEMRHMDEKSYEEIAEILELPLGTVKAHIFRAREMLYRALIDRKDKF